MLYRRIFQFFIIYFIFISSLMLVKYGLRLSDYVIPSPAGIYHTLWGQFGQYSLDTLNTLTIAVIGQVLSVIMAFMIGIAGRRSTWLSSFIKVAAYNIALFLIGIILAVYQGLLELVGGMVKKTWTGGD